MKIYILLNCFYEGDSYLVDDAYVAASRDKRSLIEKTEKDAIIYDVGETVPDDGDYHDNRKRYRIIEELI